MRREGASAAPLVPALAAPPVDALGDTLAGSAELLQGVLQRLSDVHLELSSNRQPTDGYVFGGDLNIVYVDVRRALTVLQHVLTRRGEVSTLPPDRCQRETSCCPEHGETLVAGPVETFCGVPGCDRLYALPRYKIRPCMEPREFTIIGDERVEHVCRGHAVAARARWEDARLRPYAPVPFHGAADLAPSDVPVSASQRAGWSVDTESDDGDATQLIPGFGRD